MKRHLLTLLLMGMVLGAPSASAQDTGRVGVALGYPGSLAVIWHVTDAVAIRPEFDLARDSVTYTGVRTTTSLRTSVGVSGIFYVATADNLRTYVSPQVAYDRRSSTTHGGGPSLEITTSGYHAGGSMGAQYAIGRRFSAYGELGVMYLHSEARGTVVDTTINEVSTRSAIGVIVYF